MNERLLLKKKWCHVSGGDSQVKLILTETQLPLNKTAKMEDSLVERCASQAAHNW